MVDQINIRGLLMGYDQPSFTNVIQFVTIASTGNAVDFGDDTGLDNGLEGRFF